MERLSQANDEFTHRYPGIQVTRQPVHTLYGGARLYKAGIAKKLGGPALRHFETYAEDPAELVAALSVKADAARTESDDFLQLRLIYRFQSSKYILLM